MDNSSYCGFHQYFGKDNSNYISVQLKLSCFISTELIQKKNNHTGLHAVMANFNLFMQTEICMDISSYLSCRVGKCCSCIVAFDLSSWCSGSSMLNLSEHWYKCRFHCREELCLSYCYLIRAFGTPFLVALMSNRSRCCRYVTSLMTTLILLSN